jgi:hypothetical protein
MMRTITITGKAIKDNNIKLISNITYDVKQ